MITEIKILAVVVLLGLFQLFLAAWAMTKERGVAWNMGPRDESGKQLSPFAGRLDRCYKNFMETFPFFAAAVLMVAFARRENYITTLGAEIYLVARVLYIPVYAKGITGVRTLIWGVGLIGILMILSGLL